ncbi:dUTP diphosphatase [Clostridium haemolyticum]|uniref:dUTPase n=1 Tax=Clostridium haemolyticum NCTC 9693 TaxID=1443114 RepID=A0ABR4TGZ8_CLOHA|nr:dUTP diphosphatase [Clostridium haemolyticum]KEI18278.1 hypothetical protein Z960_03965 [Clostridium haemolyticum NCTC 9693]KGN04202.1 hypothetical protein Z961_04440 [Clostridium haemolyticum NCTC 8350]
MILREMFNQQAKLDKRIIREHDLEGKDLFNNTVVSLIVELGECSNEVRFFKYWSNKGSSPKEVIAEEYADVLHFALSIGNMIGGDLIKEHNYIARMELGDLCEDFIYITNSLCSLKSARNKKHKDLTEYLYIEMVQALLGFGYKLGFTDKEIEMAYYKKNAINFKRQDQGY